MNPERLPQLAYRVVVALALPVVLIGIWWSVSVKRPNFFFPPLPDIVNTFAALWLSSRLVDDVIPSLARFFTGYMLALVLGIGLGILIGMSRRWRNALEPALEFLRAIPPPVLVPVLILFAGIGDMMKTLVIVSGCVWPILLNTSAGVRALDEVLDDTTKCYRITGMARFWHFVLPGASPQIFTGMRQAVSIGIILMVISEMFAASNGLGFAIVQFQRSFAIPEMWAGIILLGLIGIGLSWTFRIIENSFLRWYQGLRQSQRDG